MIELKDLTKRYDGFIAVKNLNLRVSGGEIFGFLGPNGAGKTTTIKMIAGVLAPSSGSITICGLDLASQAEEAKRRIGYIPDRPFLYEKLTGYEFLQFTADLYGTGKGGQDGIEVLLEMFSLAAWADELIESYSHGMKQRLIIAAALLHDPEVIVVDEPMVGLDPAGIKKVKGLFKQKAREGTAVFMSTHTLDLVEDICDRIGVIHKGELIALGTAGELREKTNVPGGRLEEIFLHLTGRQGS